VDIQSQETSNTEQNRNDRMKYSYESVLLDVEKILRGDSRRSLKFKKCDFTKYLSKIGPMVQKLSYFETALNIDFT